MKKELILLFVTAVLITSIVATQEVQAKSKTHNQVDKFLRANTIGGDKMRDLCSVSIVTDYGNNTASLKIRECNITNQTQPPVVNNTNPPPQTTCGDNEVWNGNTCECKDGFFQNGTESCIPVIPPVVNGTGDNQTLPPIDNNQTIPPVDNQTGNQTNTNQTNPPVVNETGTVKNVIMVGDIYGPDGVAVAKAIKAKNPELVYLLGDLGYGNDLSYLKQNYGDLGNKLGCIIGNHEKSLIQQALAYCANNFYTKNFNHALFIGINTDGDLAKQQQSTINLLKNPTRMHGIETVHIMTHYPCKTPPKQHHPASEQPNVPQMCDAIKAAAPTNVTLFFDNGHNHVLSESVNGQYKQSGGGGRDLYTCGTNAEFPFCKSTFGFLEYTIQPNGDTVSHFYDKTGGLIK